MNTGASFKGSSSNRTSEVLVTFSAKWRAALLSGAIKCVLRRRYPKSIVPTRMYLYVAAPFSQLIGVSMITQTIDVDLTNARALQEKTQVSESVLTQYFEGYKTIGCYFIEKPLLFDPAIDLNELRDIWSFYPPQSFVSLSREAVQWLSAKGKTELQNSSDARSILDKCGRKK